MTPYNKYGAYLMSNSATLSCLTWNAWPETFITITSASVSYSALSGTLSSGTASITQVSLASVTTAPLLSTTPYSASWCTWNKYITASTVSNIAYTIGPYS